MIFTRRAKNLDFSKTFRRFSFGQVADYMRVKRKNLLIEASLENQNRRFLSISVLQTTHA